MLKKLLFLGLPLVLAGVWIVWQKNPKETLVLPASEPQFENRTEAHDAGFFEYKKIIEASLQKENQRALVLKDQEIKIGITSHHLPTAAPLMADFYRTLANSNGSRETFVIVGPDHFERCQERVTIGREGYNTPFGRIETDERIARAFEAENFQVNDECLEGEHSIGAQAVFIKYLYPDAKIVPIILSSATKDSEIEKLTQILYDNSAPATVIASIDFSHHNHYTKTRILDAESEERIMKLNSSGLTLKYVDSPASLKLAIGLAKKMGHNQAEVISRANTFDFTQKPDDTTGYLSIIFKK